MVLIWFEVVGTKKVQKTEKENKCKIILCVPPHYGLLCLKFSNQNLLNRNDYQMNMDFKKEPPRESTTKKRRFFREFSLLNLPV